MASIDLDDLVAFKALAETHSFSAGARLIQFPSPRSVGGSRSLSLR